ncbi:serine hydrolase domain-containing protein [Segetibacter koreensis]|uniref:serine hydrolase domain-containing protein n=1 Tax=Segetibacter koreensis TaxID=398037 RepID=UPI00036945FD|nr:serine hydrolase domain-containing protein [Segetibacter koreensis]
MKSLLFFIAFIAALSACKQKDISKISSPNSNKEFSYRKLTPDEKETYKAAVEHMYDSILLKHAFNGSILVAKNGEVLLEDYHGYSDPVTKEAISPSTTFHLASVSKTFTGMAIMKLWEENKLKLDDSLQVFFPEFPYTGITVRMLLSHRSGLPNYVYFMSQDPTWRRKIATNNDMLQFMIEKKPALYGYPNRGFHYCNTNFALLALIVEKVSGQPFPEYMKNTIFTPLGMTHTFVFSKADSANYHPSFQPNNRPFPLESIDCIYGDKNVYSTVRDMYLWDQAIYNNRVVSHATYEEATKPYSLERPSIHNYGLGWRLMMLPNTKIVYHNGWWHGNNTVFTRLVDDTATIIILSNKFNKAIYAGMKIGTVFANSKKTEPEKPLD